MGDYLRSLKDIWKGLLFQGHLELAGKRQMGKKLEKEATKDKMSQR